MMYGLLLLFCAFAFGDESIPRILRDAEDVRGFPDEFSLLRVTTNDVRGATYYWMKDSKKIDKDTTPQFSGIHDRVLIPVGKGREYAGVYRFVMKAKTGTIMGRKITVEFTYLGEFDLSFQRLYHPPVVIGQANFIRCPKHTPGNNIIYKWGKRSTITGANFLVNKPNYLVLDDGTLFYSHITENDVRTFNESKWTCAMEVKVNNKNSFAWANHVETELRIVGTNMTEFGPNIVTPLPQGKRFEEGTTISMKCAATGRPTPKYSWKRIDVYGKEIAVKDGKDGITFEDRDDRLLIIDSAKKEHAGRYFCTASIGEKNDTVEGSLIFEVEPKWVGEKIKSAKPSIYSTHSWTCNASGFPEPTYKWYKDGKKLGDSGKHRINEGTVTFPRLELTDSGMYECVAENSLNNIYQTAHLNVRAEKPVFHENTGTKTLFIGNKGVIECRAKAAPSAKNTWEKDGVKIDFTFSKYTLANNENLVIQRVSKQDIGNYTCNAKNTYGSDSKKISVQVIGEINFVDTPKNIEKVRGETFKLKCKAEGDKDSATKLVIKYKWQVDGKDLVYDDSMVWSEQAHSLIFLKTEVAQSGTYECIAYIDQPSYAEKRSRAIVKIKGPPEAPNKVEIDGNCSLFIAKIMWSTTPSNQNTIKHFIIQKMTSYGVDTWYNVSENVDAKEFMWTVKNLSPFTKYRFRVLAINEIGTSAPSEPTKFDNCVTPAKEPTKCPNISAFPGKADELTLKWEKMDRIDHNGGDFHYVLEYYSSINVNPTPKRFERYQHEFKIPNAGYYHLWSYKIQGKNIVGGGPFCEGNAYSGQNAPDKAPSQLTVSKIGSRYFIVQWKKLTLKRGSVDGYNLIYNQLGTSTTSRRSISANLCTEDSTCELNISASLTSKRVDGLLPDTEYRISLRGYNSGGFGRLSAPILVRTMEDVPEAVATLTLTPYAKFVKVEWTEPNQPNGIITKYRISIDKQLNFKPIILNANTKKYIFDRLSPKTEYIVTVQPSTSKGYGKKRADSVETLSPQVPAVPKAPILKGIGENGVNVTFQEGQPEQGFPEKFLVYYRIKDGEDTEWANLTDPVDYFGTDGKPYVEIYDLNEGVMYEFTTIALNDEGKSEKGVIGEVRPGNNKKKAKAGTTSLVKRAWFIVVIAIVFLLLILLMVALLITRKRGERYPVGKREKKRAGGILDMADEADYGAYPMKDHRSNGNGVNRQNSNASMPYRDPDRDSLEAYGEEDRFAEDAASLIGVYNDDRKHGKGKGMFEPEAV